MALRVLKPLTYASVVPSRTRYLVRVSPAKKRNELRTVQVTVPSSRYPAAYVAAISWSEWITNCPKTLPPAS
jgi:hypothetical protein